MRSLVAPGTRVALEHGGVAPVLVGSTARMKKTVPKIVKGGFYHAGQVCVSVQRVFALGLAARDLAEQIGELAQELVVGNAINEGTECGPLM